MTSDISNKWLRSQVATEYTNLSLQHVRDVVPSLRYEDMFKAHISTLDLTEPAPSFHIHPVRSPRDIATATSLIKSYTDSLGIDLSYQDFSTEISQMPGKYAPEKGGEILLAIQNNSTSDNFYEPVHAEESHGGSVSPRKNYCCSCTYVESDVLGCAALRNLPSINPLRICEIKRLYILPRARSLGIGKALINAVIDTAREKGYAEMRLDTLPTMHSAIALYKSLGFEEIDAYYECDCPVEGNGVFGVEVGSGLFCE
ncbi:acetyltransferase [Coccidioides immitis RS]|uniref:acetyltransferase n=1 Tax=Coccidioides immitis (strain RS) TaxID=246410 RepID=UPI00027D2875|nr:acetyltransferase [Coccidioides immitis RS]EAS36692.3 acetyltransferase [Coccidioides immitis RS]TPX25197.1 hypothetical protein DIZ76_010646 [Coccidioides immitis]